MRCNIDVSDGVSCRFVLIDSSSDAILAAAGGLSEKEQRMDPVVAAIVAALASGAIVAAKDVATNAVKDAYAGLKKLIVSRFEKAKPFVEAVEASPESKPEQQVLARQLGAAAGDPSMKEAADRLLAALGELERDPRARAVLDFEKLHALRTFKISDAEFSGTLLTAKEATFEGDVELTNLRQRGLETPEEK